MADRYWVGGTGTWDTTSTAVWASASGGPSGASVPTTADSVFFDGIGPYTVTITGAVACNDLNVTSSPITFISGTTPTFTISGSVFLAVGTIWTTPAAKTFTATTAGKTIVTNGVTFNGGSTFNGSGGEWTLGSSFSTGTGTFTLTAGTFNTADYTFSPYSLTTTGGTVNLQASQVLIGNSITMGASTTLNAGTSTINCTTTFATLALGGKTYNVFRCNGGYTAVSLSGSNNFSVFELKANTSLKWPGLNVSGTQTVGTFLVPAPSRTSYRNGISGGTWNISDVPNGITAVDFRNVTVIGPAAPLTSVNECGDLGGNSGIIFPAGRDLYFVSGSVFGGLVCWSLTSGGTGTVDCPCVQDVAIVDNSSPSSMSFNAANNGYRVGKFDASSRTTAFTLGYGPASNGCTHYDDFLLSPSCTVSQSGLPTFTIAKPVANGSFKLSAPTAASTSSISISIPSSTTIELLNDCKMFGSITLTNATLKLNGYLMSVGTFTASTTANIDWSNGTLEVRTGGLSVQPTTTFIGVGSISLKNTAAATFAGGNKTYTTVTVSTSFAVTISGNNIIGTIADTVNGTVLFTAGSNNTITNFNLSGVAGTPFIVGSTSTVQATLTKSTPWYVGANSTNGGNNTGLLFTDGGGIDYLSLSNINAVGPTPSSSLIFSGGMSTSGGFLIS